MGTGYSVWDRFSDQLLSETGFIECDLGWCAGKFVVGEYKMMFGNIDQG